MKVKHRNEVPRCIVMVILLWCTGICAVAQTETYVKSPSDSTKEPPLFRINGIAGLNQISDSALRSASGTVQAELSLVDFSTERLKRMYARKTKRITLRDERRTERRTERQGQAGVEEQEVEKDSAKVAARVNGTGASTATAHRSPVEIGSPRFGLVDLEVTYNFNSNVELFNRDTLRLSDLLFYQRSRNAFDIRARTDILRWFTWSYTSDNPHKRTPDSSWEVNYRLCPFLSYSYARWNFNEDIIPLDSTDGPRLIDADRIQAIQWSTGLEAWYTARDKSKGNTLGLFIAASFHQRRITDGSQPVYEALLNDAANTAQGYTIPRTINYWTAEIGLQINKTRFSFSYSDPMLNVSAAIADQRVTGGVYLLRISTIANFMNI
ncbi:MAG: hypothetical protein JNN32_06935 [Flavobacteriales bacterium]|nr:hypothetical protein [Flavobacteriales bacterium]